MLTEEELALNRKKYIPFSENSGKAICTTVESEGKHISNKLQLVYI